VALTWKVETPLRNAILPLHIAVIGCHFLFIYTLIHCSPYYCGCGLPALARKVSSAFRAYHEYYSTQPQLLVKPSISRSLCISESVDSTTTLTRHPRWLLASTDTSLFVIVLCKAAPVEQRGRIWIYCADATTARSLCCNIISWY